MANSTETTLYAPIWVSEPNGRGTWSILYSCVFTLSLCVWSAIHLNIPPRGEPAIRQWQRKTKWVFIAIFAPEVVLYSSWQQYYVARRFSREIENICRDKNGLRRNSKSTWWEDTILWCINFFDKHFDTKKQPDNNDSKLMLEPSKDPSSRSEVHTQPPNLEQIEKFNIVYGYYVVMGGFVVNARELYDDQKCLRHNIRRKSRCLGRTLPYGLKVFAQLAKGASLKGMASHLEKRFHGEKADDGEEPFWVTITPRGLIELANSLPWEEFKSQFCIDKESIRDKSKADGLAKTLVSLQVLWALLNSISRLVLRYPISVLEIHTLVHAACALMMYGLWWQKPLDVRDSTIIKADDFQDKLAFREMLALMLVRTPGSAFSPYNNFEMPERWKTFGSEKEPKAPLTTVELLDNRYDCEAAFLCLDTSQSTESVEQAQSLEQEEHEARSCPVISSCISKILHDYEPKAGESELRSRSISADDEADVGISLHPPQPLLTISKPAKIYRVPPANVERVHTLSTGEMLPSGVGPSALITAQSLSSKYRFWSGLENLSERLHLRLLQRYAYRRQPLNSAVVEVDEILKPLIPLPFGIHRYKGDKSFYHKITIHLSKKDELRWNLACNAFRAELTNSDRSAHSSGSREPCETERVLRAEYSATHPDGHVNSHRPRYGSQDPKDASDGKFDAPAHDADVAENRAKLLSLQGRAVDPGVATTLNIGSFCLRSPNLDLGTFNCLVDRRLSGQAYSLFAIVMYGVISVISGVYAGIHLALWNHDFPTRVESLLWKISATSLGVPFVIFTAIVICRSISISVACIMMMGVEIAKTRACAFALETLGKPFFWLFYLVEILEILVEKLPGLRVVGKLFCYFVVLLLGGLFGVVVWGAALGNIVLYPFARVYIVVESFLSLRHVPIGVYQDVSWAQYIPHM